MRKFKAVFPGSFDPITRGHIDIIKRALNVFDEVIVGVLNNTTKETLFTVDERQKLIEEEFKAFRDNLSVQIFSGLLVDFVKEHEAQVIIRGLRAISDYDYESQMALMNKTLASSIETFFMITSVNNSYISSSLVRQIAQFGGDVSKLVSPHVEAAVKAKFSKQ